MKLILASNSPRRREILSGMRLEFTVCPSYAGEICDPALEPFELTEQNALIKGRDVYEKLKDSVVEDGFIISADTVVDFYGEALGKPKDREDAVRMLSSLSGGAHSVHTGYAIIRLSDGAEVSGVETTYVTFADLSTDDIEYILDHDNPYDKAGSYAIQGAAMPFICGITGCYMNVVGLPVAAIRAAMLENFGVKLETLA